MASKKIKVTLVKSLIGRHPKHKLIIEALGLGKRGSSVVHQENDAIRGMINKIAYLVNVEECA